MYSWLVCMSLYVFIYFVTNLYNFHSVLSQDDLHILRGNGELK